MKIAAVAYRITFLLPPFFGHSLAEPVIGERKSFTTTNVQNVSIVVSDTVETASGVVALVSYVLRTVKRPFHGSRELSRSVATR